MKNRKRITLKKTLLFLAESTAFIMGYDAGKNKPTIKNSHFLIFTNKKTSIDWQRGYKQGREEKEVKNEK